MLFRQVQQYVLLAPSPSALQDLLDCCEEYARLFDIIYNVKKTFCMCIKPKCYKDLQVPTFYLNRRSLTFTSEQKYLGFMMTDAFTDDNDITRQMKYMYCVGNSLVRNFKHCNDEVKLQLFKTYCTNFYCCQLWSVYKNNTMNKLRVAYNNVFRNMFKLARDASISYSMLLCNLEGFQAVVRKQSYGFRQRIYHIDNFLVKTIVNSMSFSTNKINIMWINNLFKL